MICVCFGLADNVFLSDIREESIWIADAMYDEEAVQEACRDIFNRETTRITYRNGDTGYWLWQPGIGLINPRLLLELRQKQKWFLERGAWDFWPF